MIPKEDPMAKFPRRLGVPLVLPAVLVVTFGLASTSGLQSSASAHLAAATTALPARESPSAKTPASLDVITDSKLENAFSGLFAQTHGHQQLVTISHTPSYFSQINCVEYTFPDATTHPACELENESGLCLDASTTYKHVTAESCAHGNAQEEWWAKTFGQPGFHQYNIINAWWSSYAGQYRYMTENGYSPGSPIGGNLPSGYGFSAVWIYGA
jgi:hypothetical protein